MLALTAPNVIAAKGTGKIRLGYWLQPTALTPTDAYSLFLAVDALKELPRVYVVRGALADSAPRNWIRRRSTHEPYHLVDVPQQWLCVDVDGRPSAIDCFADPMRAAKFVRSSLPDGLRHTLCYYAITGSCKPHALHAHFWFWLDRPYTHVEIKRALAGHKVDMALYRATQPHFTAAPLIPVDPLAGRRRGILEGEPIGWLGKAPMQADPQAAEAALQAAMSDIAGQSAGNRHRAINRHAYYMGVHVASRSIERRRVIEALQSVAELAGLTPDRAGDEVMRGLADGIEAAPNREAWLDHLTHNKDGVPVPSYHSAVVALSESVDWQGCLAYSERHARVEWLRDPPISAGFGNARQGRPLHDEHAAIAADWCSSRGLIFQRKTILDAMIDVAHKQAYDPLRNMLEELDWDGTPRISDWVHTYLGANVAKADWHQAIGRRWLIAAVARVYQRGCKADNVLVLEGKQGFYKSTALDILGMGYTKEVRIQLDDKDASDALHAGAWIAVLTELDAFKRTSRAESVKAFLTMIEDYYRPSYGRITQSFPRSIVFAATTNEESYLNDPTGNRRFWPVRCGRVDLDALRRDREQLWAEARQAYLDGEPWWLDSDPLVDVATIEQAERLMHDSWEDYITAYCGNKDFVTVKGVLTDAIEMLPAQQSPPSVARVQSYLRRMGFHIAIRHGIKGWERMANGAANGGTNGSL